MGIPEITINGTQTKYVYQVKTDREGKSTKEPTNRDKVAIGGYLMVGDQGFDFYNASFAGGSGIYVEKTIWAKTTGDSDKSKGDVQINIPVGFELHSAKAPEKSVNTSRFDGELLKGGINYFGIYAKFNTEADIGGTNLPSSGVGAHVKLGFGMYDVNSTRYFWQGINTQVQEEKTFVDANVALGYKVKLFKGVYLGVEYARRISDKGFGDLKVGLEIRVP